MGPLIPYIKVPEIPLSFLPLELLHKLPGAIGKAFNPAHPPTIKPFGTLVAFGVYLGSVVAMSHARERKLDDRKVSSFIFWVVGWGFVGGHVLDAIFYHPERIPQDPFYLISLWDGLSSYGGFIGAILGALGWRAKYKEGVLDKCEVVNSAFPLAWVFGRMGCASVHDHPGKLSDAWFAVRWPMPHGGVAGRYDLGLIEMALTIPLALGFLIAWRRKPFRPLGFYSGWMCVAYAPVRFIMDFFREFEGSGVIGGDPRYGGLTPAQWACFGLFAIGVYFLRIAKKNEALGVIGAPSEQATEATSDEASAGEAASEEPKSDEATSDEASAGDAEADADEAPKKKKKKKRKGAGTNK